MEEQKKLKTQKHSFARQYLDHLGASIYSGGVNILEYRGKPKYEVDQINTAYEVSPDTGLLLEPKIKTIESYNKIRELGFVICSIKAKEKTFSGQYKQYILVRYFPSIKHINRFPRPTGSHFVEYDTANKRLRLRGQNAGLNGYGQWAYIDGKSHRRISRPTPTYDLNDYLDNPRGVSSSILDSLLGTPEKSFIMEIPELPVILTASNELVCIPQTRDEPTIGIVGQRRSGKSYLMHSIIDRAFWKKGWNKKIALLNDGLRETTTWTLKNESEDGLVIFKRLNEQPRPLPLVHISPMTDDVFDVPHQGEVGFAMTLPYKELITNSHNYFSLDKSQNYFDNMREALLECTTVQQVSECIRRNIQIANTVEKIEGALLSLFKKKLVDLSTNIPSLWNVNIKGFHGEYNPITACLVAGVIPVFDSATIINKEYYPHYFRYIGEDLFARQKRDLYFKNKSIQLWLVLEEMHDVAGTTAPIIAKETVNKLITQGGPLRIGFIGVTQNYSKIIHRARSNLKYLFSFVVTSEASVICREYMTSDFWREELQNLDVHECVAMTKEYFVVYTPDGKKYKSKGPFKGKAIPPLSLHKAPKEDN